MEGFLSTMKYEDIKLLGLCYGNSRTG